MGTSWRSCANCTRFSRSLTYPCFWYTFLSTTAKSWIRVMSGASKGSITRSVRICVWSGMPSHGRMRSFMVVRRWNIRCVVVHRCMVMSATVTSLVTWANLVGRSLRWIVRCRRLAWLKLSCRLSLRAFSVLHAGVWVVNPCWCACGMRHRVLSLWLATRSDFRTRQACSAIVLRLLAFGDDIRAKIRMLKILASMELDPSLLL